MNASLVSNDRVVAIAVGSEVRFFISLGNPGFNLPANNRNGYATYEAAMAASKRCENRK